MTALATRGLTKAFGGLVAVDGVDLDVAEGEIHALIGPNGAGKTTVLNLVARLYEPSRGTIALFGRDLAGVRPHRLASLGLARTFQHMELFPALSGLENVMIGAHVRGRTGLLAAVLDLPSARRERAALADEALGLLDLVGLKHLAERRTGILTAGQGRLLGLARALASRPRLLLLDELVAGLNTEETAAAAALVRRIRDTLGITILAIEHDMRFVMAVSDRITVLNFGRCIATGRPDAIRRDPAVIEAYLGRGHDAGG